MDSPICLAALHAKVLKPKKAGWVKVTTEDATDKEWKIDEGGDSIKTMITDSVSKTKAFTVEEGMPPIQITCKDNMVSGPTAIKFIDGTKYLVVCPKDCHKKYSTEKVYGNFVEGYSSDSSICLAAMNAGVLTDISSK